MGGRRERFDTTHWSEIARARTLDDAHRRAVLDDLIRRYWKPVYCYLRRKGHGNERAKDLTQGFFHEIVVARDLVERAERAKGRFRTFLLTALDHYVRNVHRAETAKKRRPADGLVSLERLGPGNVPEPSRSATPEEAFHQAWASALLDGVLDEVREAYVSTGRAPHWHVFYGRVIGPILEGAEPVPLGELCERHGIASEVTASNMAVTVKRRFEAVLRSHVREFVETEADVDREIAELIDILSGKGA
jgi:RNA polymerase sigma-70 factor (ECF subfamily)